jgi:F-type H+-transporting ATPase subunit delta
MQAVREAKAIDATAADLDLIDALYQSSREFRILLGSPVVTPQKKMRVFQELFASRVGNTTLAFVNLMTAKQRERLLPEIVEQFRTLRDELYGIITVEVAAAVELSDAQEQQLTRKLEGYTRKRVRMRFSLDKSLKGGLMVKIGDTVLDASVRRQLELLREQLVEGGTLRN